MQYPFLGLYGIRSSLTQICHHYIKRRTASKRRAAYSEIASRWLGRPQDDENDDPVDHFLTLFFCANVMQNQANRGLAMSASISHQLWTKPPVSYVLPAKFIRGVTWNSCEKRRTLPKCLQAPSGLRKDRSWCANHAGLGRCRFMKTSSLIND
ncbi:hypothetical protein BDW68DRAFT_150943 [Aspergillus falconensis]